VKIAFHLVISTWFHVILLLKCLESLELGCLVLASLIFR
jgi:hypothetical protein